QWSWYTSIVSIPSRRSEPSQAVRTSSGRKPVPEGAGPTFVAIVTSSRRPSTARPTSVSDTPSPYTSAVSTPSMPASNPARIASITVASDALGPQSAPPASHAPNPITDSSGPRDPSRLVRMPSSNHTGSGTDQDAR